MATINKRDLFGELMEGVESMRLHREGKVTLRTYKPVLPKPPKVDGLLIRKTREKLGMSQGLFARMIRVNPRTLSNWEQDRSKPNEQAATLILLIRKHPEILKLLRDLAA